MITDNSKSKTRLLIISLVLAAVLLTAGPAPARWQITSRPHPLSGVRFTAAERCDEAGRCFEVYEEDGEVWGRVTLPEEWPTTFVGPEAVRMIIDRKQPPFHPELFLIEPRLLKFQIWDGRGRLPKHMRRLVKGRRVYLEYAVEPSAREEMELSLRGSSGPIKRVIRAINKSQVPPPSTQEKTDQVTEPEDPALAETSEAEPSEPGPESPTDQENSPSPEAGSPPESEPPAETPPENNTD